MGGHAMRWLWVGWWVGAYTAAAASGRRAQLHSESRTLSQPTTHATPRPLRAHRRGGEHVLQQQVGDGDPGRQLSKGDHDIGEPLPGHRVLNRELQGEGARWWRGARRFGRMCCFDCTGTPTPPTSFNMPANCDAAHHHYHRHHHTPVTRTPTTPHTRAAGRRRAPPLHNTSLPGWRQSRRAGRTPPRPACRAGGGLVPLSEGCRKLLSTPAQRGLSQCAPHRTATGPQPHPVVRAAWPVRKKTPLPITSEMPCAAHARGLGSAPRPQAPGGAACRPPAQGSSCSARAATHWQVRRSQPTLPHSVSPGQAGPRKRAPASGCPWRWPPAAPHLLFWL